MLWENKPRFITHQFSNIMQIFIEDGEPLVIDFTILESMCANAKPYGKAKFHCQKYPILSTSKHQ